MKKTSVLFGGLVIIIIGFFVWWTNGIKAPDPKNTTESIFVINKGTAIRQVGNELKEQGFIKDPVIYFIYLKKMGLETAIQAGSYKLSPSMTLPEVMDTLQHGTIDVWVTIPEGYRAEEIAEALEENLSTYQPEWLEKLRQNEGYLFPDTYLIPNEADIDNVISIMRNNFNTKVQSIGLNPNDDLEGTVIIASLIEREALFHEDFSYVSSIIANRLELGMPLQLDATVQYALGYSEAEKKWWRVPTPADLKINSAYNTYLNAGLTPGPIGNPGIDAIEAAVSPKNTNYLYYINDSSGKLHFSETLDEHNRNINQFLK